MIRWIVGSSLRGRLLVVSIAAVIMIVGFTQLRNMPVDVLPEFSDPYVEIQTESLGLSASELEGLITVTLEQDMLSQLPWLEEISSETMPGLSSIRLKFKPGTDIIKARQVSESQVCAFDRYLCQVFRSFDRQKVPDAEPLIGRIDKSPNSGRRGIQER